MTKINEMSYTELERYANEVIAELKRKAYAAGYEQGQLNERAKYGIASLDSYGNRRTYIAE